MNELLTALLEERAANWERNGAPLERALRERALTEEEQRQFDAATAAFDAKTARIDAAKAAEARTSALAEHSTALGGGRDGQSAATADAGIWRNLDTGEAAALRSGQSISTHPVFQRAQDNGHAEAARANYGTLGALVRAMATGGAGSALVPTAWAGGLIDRSRQLSVAANAGATVIPMDAGTVKVGRLTADPTVAFRAENGTITPSDPTFDSLTLTARTLSGIVTGSREWFQDTPNADELVEFALAKAVADLIDLAALYGGITSGAGAGINLATPPNPRGILAALNATLSGNVLGGATNGTTQTAAGSGNFWAEIIQTVFKVKRGNEIPNAIVWNSALSQQYATAVDTTGQPLAVPPAIAELDLLETNRIPSYTQGDMTNVATDVFVGDFRQLLIGTRLDLTVQPLPELYAASGQFGVLVELRIDTALARSTAFAVFRALKGAA